MHHHGDKKVEAVRFLEQHVAELDIRSDALDRVVTVRLLTPRDWVPRSSRTWPTLYLLHGGDDQPACWSERTDIGARALDADVLVVLPPGGRAGFYTDWLLPDSYGTTPAWEQFHIRELHELIETEFSGNGRRAVAGVSMGGYGAVTLAAKYPGRFAAAASYSGMLHTTRLGTSALLHYFLRSVGERMKNMWGSRWSHRAHWRTSDPYWLVDELAATPLYIAAGDGDRVPGDPPAPGDRMIERIVAPASRALAKRLEQRGHPMIRTSFGAGTHDWPSWQRELGRSWPFLLAALTEREISSMG
nr:alpha/beta hydrolase family protein [Kibdelosporangium sp. MJ126-NF4]CEL14128.1 putative secreted protein [Kibdelosporangium sp. MJ126-NF4]CTQ88495.1 putative secreted protein [Kibdelosporangium sp. MJ126-NF4]